MKEVKMEPSNKKESKTEKVALIQDNCPYEIKGDDGKVFKIASEGCRKCKFFSSVDEKNKRIVCNHPIDYVKMLPELYREVSILRSQIPSIVNQLNSITQFLIKGNLNHKN